MEKLALSLGGQTVSAPGGVPTGGSITLNHIVQIGFAVLISVGVILSLAYLIWGGFDWITSEGDKQKVERSRQKIVFAIVGLIIIFVSFLAIRLFLSFFLGTPDAPCPLPRPGQSNPC